MAFDLDDEELKATRKLNGVDDSLYKESEIENKEIEEFFRYIKSADKAIKEKGKMYDFKCPLCGGNAKAIRNTYNGHLWSRCGKCEMVVMQ